MSRSSSLLRVNSFQSLGALDGPGIRFVVFVQGCPLRCGCCHNPETQPTEGGQLWRVSDLLDKARRFRPYFGKNGGITVSGGEPLLQDAGVEELFSLCRREGISTCLDTSGCCWDDSFNALLNQTDFCLLDIKYTNEADYRRYAGCSLRQPLFFLSKLEEKGVATRLRQVLIPGYNDTPENVGALARIAAAHSCVRETEWLPFSGLCREKYEKLGKAFPFAHVASPSRQDLTGLAVYWDRDSGPLIF